MNLKTLLKILFLGLRHHFSERLFPSGFSILQKIERCRSLFLIGTNPMPNVTTIIFLPILL
jgi:hypothetical protein